jgi:hypothetical protein
VGDLNMKSKILIGSDPEFIITDSHNHMVSAAEFFAGCKDCDPCRECGKERDKNRCNDCDGDDCNDCSTCRDDVGHCQVCNDCNYPLMNSEVGTDGYDEVGELRPEESEDPLEHHATIAGLIHSIKLPSGYKLLAGTIQKENPIGGHIHIGHDEIQHPHILANYLSYYCGIPLKRIERGIDLRHRGMDENSYGYFGQYDSKDYGIEFRMPASWLVNSVVAKAALCLTHVVAYEFIEVGDEEEIELSESDYVSVVRGDNINNIIQKIRGMSEFNEYSSEIEPLLVMIENKHVWNVDSNLQEVW